MTLRKSGGPRINRITAGITSYTTVKRLRFPLACQYRSPRTPFMDHETKGEENGHAYVQSPSRLLSVFI